MDCPDLSNVQGMVVHRYDHPLTTVLLFTILDAAKVKGFLRKWRHLIPLGATEKTGLKGPLLSIGLTWNGLSLLVDNDPALDPVTGGTQLDFAFTDRTPEHPGMSEQLGFLGPSAPENWWDQHFKNADIHLALFALFDDQAQQNIVLEDIRTSAALADLKELKLTAFEDGAMNGQRPAGGFLHFGYRDGVTSPTVDWNDERKPGSVDFREFITGYPSKTHPVGPVTPGPWREFAKDASYACLAWIHQDVAAFNRFLATNVELARGKTTPGQESAWVAARMMGRWPDGSSIVRHSKVQPNTPDFDNSFSFKDDPEGVRCPLTAHIRVVNPRDDELTFPNASRFPAGPPKFIRRGFSYGPTLDATVDDGKQRGLVGIFMCARVNEQFYTALRWINQTGFTEPLHRQPYTEFMQDALFGSRTKPRADTRFFVTHDDGTVSQTALPDFIVYRGVCNFMLPGMATLDRLAAPI